jgi:hypothetical protein
MRRASATCFGALKVLWSRGRAKFGYSAGAGEGNRTLVVSLGSFCSTIELHPRAAYFTLVRACNTNFLITTACVQR